MKKNAKLLVATGILVLMCGAYVGIKRVNTNEEVESSEQISEEIISIEVSDINAFSFSSAGEKVAFSKQGEEWVNENDVEFPVDVNAVTEALNTLSQVKAERVLENTNDMQQYGLEQPQNIITIDTDEESYSIKVGNLNESISQYYVLQGDDDSKVYLVDSSSIDVFTKNLYDFAEMTPFPDIEADNIYSLEITQNDSLNSYSLEKQRDLELWNVIVDGNYKDADSSKISDLITGVTSLVYDGFVNYNCEDMQTYGLENPYAEIVIGYQTKKDEENVEETSEESDIEMIDQQLTIYVGNEDGNGARYIKINESKEVYTISEDILNTFLEKKAVDLQSLVVNYHLISNVEQLNITYDEKTNIFNVSRETLENEDGEEYEETTYQCNGVEIDESSFMSFYNKLSNMTAQKLLEDKYETDEKPEFSATFKDIEGEETVEYYYYDTNFYAAVKNDEVYLINKMNYNEMIEAYRQLADSEEE